MNDEFLAAVEAIKNADEASLKQILSSENATELLSRTISQPPTNHAIGKDATLLQLASYRTRGGIDLSPLIIDKGVEIDLHSACGLGKTDEISTILHNDPGALNHQVDTYYPMQYAITANRPQAVACLLKHGDDPNRDLKKMAYFGWEDDALKLDYVPWKPIHMASLYGFDASRIPVAQCLIDSGADLNAVSPLDGYRPIHLVAMPNRIDMIKFYVENGIDVDSRSVECKAIRLGPEEDGSCAQTSGNTPLMISAGEGFTEASECLLDLGADVNAQNDQGQTALHLAAKRFWNGQPYDEVLDLLLKRGADKTVKDEQGNLASL